MIGKNYSSLSLQPSYINRTMSEISDAIQEKCLAFGDRIIKLNDYLLEQARQKYDGGSKRYDVRKGKSSFNRYSVIPPVPVTIRIII